MKLIFVVASIFIVGTLAGSPGYLSSSDTLYPSSGWICDSIKAIVDGLAQAALDALKQAIINRINGRSDDLDAATKSKLLVQAIVDVKAHQEVSEKDKNLLDSLINRSNVGARAEGWGFDLDSAWDCLKEIFSDLFNASSSATVSSSES